MKASKLLYAFSLKSSQRSPISSGLLTVSERNLFAKCAMGCFFNMRSLFLKFLNLFIVSIL